MKIKTLALTVLATLILVGCNNYTYDTAGGDAKTFVEQREEAKAKAIELFKEKKEEGLSVAKGPCLSEEIIPGWAVDIVNVPKNDFDKDPANQCQSLVNNQVKHFVELNKKGEVVRAF